MKKLDELRSIMGKIDTRIKRALNAIADECDDDVLLFSTIITSNPQPRDNYLWINALERTGIGFAGTTDTTRSQTPQQFARHIVRVLTNDISYLANSPDASEMPKWYAEIADWLEDVLETRVDVLRDKLEQKHMKHGAVNRDAPLGRYAFAPNRVRQRGMPTEPNTPSEEKLLNNLAQYVNRGQILPDTAAKQLQTLLKRGLYQDVIHEPKQKTFYRGMSVSRTTLAKLIGKSQNAIPKKGSIERSVKISPKRGAGSSWSTSKKVALDFTGGSHNVILIATSEDNPDRFVSGPDGFYKVEPLDQMSNEKEALGLGPIKISKIEWFVDSSRHGYD